MTITITKAVFVISLFLITPQSLQRRFVHDHHNHPVSYCAMRRIARFLMYLRLPYSTFLNILAERDRSGG